MRTLKVFFFFNKTLKKYQDSEYLKYIKTCMGPVRMDF